MRVFIAGATGAVGRRLAPLALRAGHQVTGMTRSEDKAGAMRAGGAEAVVFFYPHRRRGVRHTLGDRARRSRSLQHRRQRAGSGCRMAAVSCPDDRCAAAAAHPGMARPAADGRARAGDDERDPWCRQYQSQAPAPLAAALCELARRFPERARRLGVAATQSFQRKRVAGNWLHGGYACFETRSSSAPQHEESA